MLTGEKPEVNAEVAARLAEYGHEDFISYVAWACERALERGMLPHTNLGVLHARRAGPAARGHGLAGADAGVGQPGPGGAPGLADQAPGGCGSTRSGRPASCASRSPAGSWWGSGRRPRSAWPRWRRSPRSTREHGHLQEVILQNFVPHPRYYGAEPAEIADAAAQQRLRGHDSARRAGPLPALGHADLARRHARAGARVPPADARRGHPDPAQPVRLVAAAGGGGRHRPGRPVRQRRPHLARAPVPVRAPDAQAAPAARLRAHRAALRLPAVHGPALDGAGRARRGEAPLLVASSRAAARAGARSGRSGGTWYPARSRAPARARRCRPTS